MISIRLSRVGKTGAPVYRIVVQPKHRDPWSPAIEILGHYNPRKEPKEIVIKNDRIKYWLSQGAEATDTVWNMLVDEKIVEGKKRSTPHISNTHASRLETKVTEAKAESEKQAEA
ncbi:MAG: 30S ribosomal protein S16, partial [Bacteroidota bacterium]